MTAPIRIRPRGSGRIPLERRDRRTPVRGYTFTLKPEPGPPYKMRPYLVPLSMATANTARNIGLASDAFTRVVAEARDIPLEQARKESEWMRFLETEPGRSYVVGI